MLKRKEERQRIGQRIAELRKVKGLTQTQLAEATGLQRTHIVRIEQGIYGATIDVLSQIADALGCEVDFVGQNDEEL